MISKILGLIVCALLVNSAEAQVNPAAGVVLNNASNTASGSYSGVGGAGSVSSGVGGLVWGIGSRQLGGGSAFGRNVFADGTDAHATGQGVTVLRDNGVGSGWQNLSSGILGIVSGHQSTDRGIQGASAHAVGSFVNTGDAGQGRGDAQRIELILRTTTTDGTPTQLSSSALNSPAAIAPNVTVLTVPDNGTMRVKGGVVAREPSTGLSRSWDLTALIKKVNGTTVLVGSTVTPEFADSGATWGFDLGADTQNGSLGMYATGAAGHTVQWVARVISIENVGGSGGPPPPPPPPNGTNVALASNGAVATASSIYNSNYPVLAVNDGDRIGRRWGQGGTGSGWNDASAGIYPDWVQIQFPAAKTINSIVVYTVQDGNISAWIEPTDTMTFSQYGITDFQVQGWNGTSWDVLGSATGNNLVKRTFQFANYTTDRIRVWITNASPENTYDYSRVVEIEAWGN